MYHCDFWCALALFSPLGHGFCSIFFLKHLKRTRRYITRRDRGLSDNRGASYRHRKPPKLAGYQFRNNWSRRLLFVVLRGILYVAVCCVLQTYKQLRCTFGPPHVFSNIEKVSKRVVSNVWCKSVCMYDGRVFCLACKRHFLHFFLWRVKRVVLFF